MDSGVFIEGLPSIDQGVSLDALNSFLDEPHESQSAIAAKQPKVLQQVSSWLDQSEQSKPVLWIHGGTSVDRRSMAQSVVDTCRLSKQLGASFFFRKGSPGCGEAIYLFPTIAYQLASNIPALAEAMKTAPVRIPTKPSEMPSYFHSLIVQPIKSTPFSAMPLRVIVIDGLDECDNRDQAQQTIMDCVAESVDQRLPFRFLITSGDQPDLSQAFEADRLRESTVQLLMHSASPLLDPPEIEKSLHQDRPSRPIRRKHVQLSSYPQIVTVHQRNGYQESFCRSLLFAGHGFPLWRPSGNLAMSVDYLLDGVSIGDVGMIDESGAFTFYFNIFLPPDHPAQARVLPREFHAIEPPLQPNEVIRHENYFKPGQIIASKGVIIKERSEVPLDVHFTSTEPDGGIVILPNGASREDLVSTDRLHEYARKNGPHWYQYINHYGRTLYANGSLFLVTGCDKANDWAIASFPSRPGRTEDHLDLHYTWRPDFGCPWFDPGTAEAKYYSPPKKLPKDCKKNNQCIFVRGMRISLTQQSWRRTLPFDDGAKLHYSLILDTPSKFQRRLNSILCFLRLRLPEERAVDIVTNKDPHLFHPNYVISQVLSAAYPDAELALLDDTAWCSLVNNEMCTIRNVNDLVTRILRVHDIVEENGIITLRTKKDRASELVSRPGLGVNDHCSILFQEKPAGSGSHNRRLSSIFQNPDRRQHKPVQWVQSIPIYKHAKLF